MIIKFGNLNMAQFATAVGADFTPEELGFLESRRSSNASMTDPNGFHIFDDPRISITIGSEAVRGRVAEFFKAANARKTFNREVTFYPSSDEAN